MLGVLYLLWILYSRSEDINGVHSPHISYFPSAVIHVGSFICGYLMREYRLSTTWPVGLFFLFDFEDRFGGQDLLVIDEDFFRLGFQVVPSSAWISAAFVCCYLKKLLSKAFDHFLMAPAKRPRFVAIFKGDGSFGCRNLVCYQMVKMGEDLGALGSGVDG